MLNGEKPDQEYCYNLRYLNEVTMGLAYNLYEDGYQLKQQIERRKDPVAYDAQMARMAKSETDMAQYYYYKEQWRIWCAPPECEVFLAE